MSDNQTEFSSLASDSSNAVANTSMSSPDSASHSVDERPVNHAEISDSSNADSYNTKSAKLAEQMIFPPVSEQIPIENALEIMPKDIERNREVRDILEEHWTSDCMRYARYSREEREKVQMLNPSWTAIEIPEPIVVAYEKRRLHKTLLIQLAFQDERLCRRITSIFYDTGKFPIGIFSINNSVDLMKVGLVLFLPGSYNPAKTEDIIENNSMSFLQIMLNAISDALGIECIGFNFDILQLGYGSSLGNKLRKELRDHPQIQKMFDEAFEFYQLCRDRIFPLIFDVINKMVNPKAVKFLCSYYSEDTIKMFSKINNDVPSFINKIMKNLQIQDKNSCKIKHFAHFLRATLGVTEPVLQELESGIGKMCNAVSPANDQKPDYDLGAIIAKMDIFVKDKNLTVRSSSPKNLRLHYGSIEDNIHPESETKSMGILEIEVKVRNGDWKVPIPNGKTLREEILYCAHNGKVLGNSGYYVHRTDAGLKKLIIKCQNGGGGPVSNKVYYGNTINDVEAGQDFPNKSKDDMVPFMRNKFPKRFEGKSDQQIRNVISDTIRKKGSIGRNGLSLAYSNGDLVEVLEKKLKPVYYGTAINDVEAGQDFPYKSMDDMVPFMRNKKLYEGKSDQHIRNVISNAIRKKVRVGGLFVAYSNGDLVEVLEAKQTKKKGKAKVTTKKQTKKKGKAKATTKKQTKKKGKAKATTGKTTSP